MLMEDRFEHITAWEGRTGDYKMSDIYSYGDEEQSYLLLEELNGDRVVHKKEEDVAFGLVEYSLG